MPKKWIVTQNIKTNIKIADRSRGSTLILVLVTLTVVAILAGAVADMMMGNLKMTKHQEDSMKAYYLALTGVDLGVAALLQQDEAGTAGTLLEAHYSESAHSDIADTPVLLDTVSFEDGDVDIEIRAQNIDNERWIKISAVGRLNSGGTRSTSLRLLASNPSVKIRSQQ